jgi:hypothetical protein
MSALGLVLIGAAYAAGLWAYCLLRGYNITPAELFAQTWPATKAA